MPQQVSEAAGCSGKAPLQREADQETVVRNSGLTAFQSGMAGLLLIVAPDRDDESSSLGSLTWLCVVPLSLSS